MAMQANGNISATLARLSEDAARAGCALACEHESADELHRSLVKKYLSAHPLKHPLAYAVVVGLGRTST
jgi:hypothetical protein